MRQNGESYRQNGGEMIKEMRNGDVLREEKSGKKNLDTHNFTVLRSAISVDHFDTRKKQHREVLDTHPT